jgi:hypothetical protein
MVTEYTARNFGNASGFPRPLGEGQGEGILKSEETPPTRRHSRAGVRDECHSKDRDEVYRKARELHPKCSVS